MKVSIVISIYNSHGVLERQIKHFEKMDLADVEVILIDDCSHPPLQCPTLKDFYIYNTNNNLAWTQGLGRNLGAKNAIGEYLLMTDIDHIITQDMIDKSREFKGSFMRFNRYLGILDENGDLKYDVNSLRNYGAKEKYLKKDEPGTGIHTNTFLIKRDIFNEIGGYKDEWCNYGFHPLTGIGDDVYFDSAWRKYAKKHNLVGEVSSKVYVFPNGRFHKDGNKNPFGLFHDLNHEQNKFYKEEKYATH